MTPWKSQALCLPLSVALATSLVLLSVHLLHRVTKVTGGIVTLVDTLRSTHEEADDRILLHINHAVSKDNFSRVIVASIDTDVMVCLLCHFVKWRPVIDELWVVCGTSQNRKAIPVHNLVAQMSMDVCTALPAAHALTGCDSTSKVGTKKVALKMAHKHHELLRDFGEATLDDTMFEAAEKYMSGCVSGADSTITSFDELRYHQYHHNQFDLVKLPATSSTMQVAKMEAQAPVRMRKPMSIDHQLLKKYRVKGKSEKQTRELLKCAAEGQTWNVTAERCLITYIRNPGWVCPGGVIRLGSSKGDGGWSACVSPKRGFTKPCVVLSFGINNDWKFDDAVSNIHGCEVHAFDPTMNKAHHNRASKGKIHFYDVGLSDTDQLNYLSPYRRGETWPVMTFKSILSMLRLSDKHINMVKMDIELGEMAAMPPLLRDGLLDNVALLAFEVHLPGFVKPYNKKFRTWFREIPLKRYADLFIGLEDANFALYYTRPNLGALRSKFYGNVSFFEMHYFNKAFIKSML